MKAYLDIETTGLSPTKHKITVLGIVLDESEDIIQFVDKSISKRNLLEVLTPVSTIYTFNGTRFDLQFIRYHLGIDLAISFNHHDLMYDCWGKSLFGGLKAVEKQLGIARKLPCINGRDAITLWNEYHTTGNRLYLDALLAYNQEDVFNLRLLHRLLASTIIPARY